LAWLKQVFGPETYTWSNNLGIAYKTTIENVKAGSGNDTVLGNDVANNLSGGAGNDTIDGGAGNDTIDGGGGDDTLNGGSGIDTLVLSGSYTDYDITFKSSGVYKVKDNRAGSPDGTDTVTNFEFTNANGALYYFASSIAAWVISGFQSVLRQDPYANSSISNPFPSGSAAAAFNALVKTAEVSGFSVQQAQAKVIELARQTTSVATIAYEFFTGLTPRSAGLDYLVSPTGGNANNLNSAYYQNFGLENRYINFAVNLGKIGEGKAAFAAGYSSLSLFDATRKAYTTLFGSTPSDTKLHALLDPTFALNGTTMTRSDYFAYYGGDGPNGIGTKAAMVGWLMSEAVKADVGIYATANDLYLTDLANGKSVYAVDLVGVYHGTPFISG
jgi:serralysin